MTSQELVDRQLIQDTLVRYCHAVDQRDWGVFETVFTQDSQLDFTAFGGPRCGRIEMARYLESVIATMQRTQHTISTSLVERYDNAAVARTAAQVMMISASAHGGSHVLFVGLWYRDRLARTRQGWRIRERVQEFGWAHNRPAG